MGHTEHTPGKLYIDDNHIHKNDEIVIAISTKPYAIASLVCEKHDEEMKANAARIVTCWNEYDQLKAENEDLKLRVSELEKAKGE